MNLFVSGREWLGFSSGELRTLGAWPRLAGPARLVWAPERAVTGVQSLEGNVRHAAVLIERRLRAEGSVEGDVKVFIHQLRTVGQGYQALYSAVPLDEWQRLLAWVNGLPHHCLLLPCTALVWDTVKEGAAAVLHNGCQLLFLGLFEGRMLHVNTIAYSDSDEDALIAARTLGERVREELAEFSVEGRTANVRVHWCGVQRAWPAQPADGLQAADGSARTLANVFMASSGCPVLLQDEAMRTGPDGRTVFSAIPWLTRRAGVRLAVNPIEDKWGFQADRYLPACVAACVLMSLAAIATGAGWLLQSREALQRTARLSIQQAAAAQRLQALGDSTQMPASLADQLAFLDAAQKLNAGPDIASLLVALKAASSPDVRILGIRIEDIPRDRKLEHRAEAFLVDGMLSDTSPDQGGSPLSFFVRSLRQDGYEVEAVDAPVPAAGASASSRLFSYRVQMRKTAELRS